MMGFGSDGGGDIWSSAAFECDSPLTNLLDSDNFTLEQLLAEDELLQEIRGCHDQLIAYLSTEESVTRLVQYVIQPPRKNNEEVQQLMHPKMNNTSTTDREENTSQMMNGFHNSSQEEKLKTPGAWLSDHIPVVPKPDVQQHDPMAKEKNIVENDLNLVNIRFPFMACEIFCSDVPSITYTLMHGRVVNPTQNDNDRTYVNGGKKEYPPTATEIVTTMESDDVEVITSGPAVLGESDIKNDDMYNSSNIESYYAMTTTTGSTNPTSNDFSGTILDLLFDLLYDTKQGELDDYRAGYFDRILVLLFRKYPDEMAMYVNSNGMHRRNRYVTTNDNDHTGTANNVETNSSLMSAMLKHLCSYSIMQISQRLLLPQRPSGKPTGGAETKSDEPDDPDEYDENDVETMDDDVILAGDDMSEPKLHCDWSSSPEALYVLLGMLLDTDVGNYKRPTSGFNDDQKLDLSLNASEVLVTMIQNSMLSSNAMLTLTRSDIVLRIIKGASILPENVDYFSPNESLLTSAMNVLECLILQLGGYGLVGTMSLLQNPNGEDDEDDEYVDDNINNESNKQNQMINLMNPNGNNEYVNDTSNINQVGDMSKSNDDNRDNGLNQDADMNVEEGLEQKSDPLDLNDEQYMLDADLQGPHNSGEGTLSSNIDNDNDENGKNLIADMSSILEHLPFLLDNFTNLLRHPSTLTWKSPMQYSVNKKDPDQQLLGSSRWRIVRVIESLVLLGNPDLDAILVQQGECLEICVNFFWQFQWCSMLHQSVANLLVHVFEGQNARYEMQEFFLYKCNLLHLLMNSFVDESARLLHNMNHANKQNVSNATEVDEDDDYSHCIDNIVSTSEGVGNVEGTEDNGNGAFYTEEKPTIHIERMTVENLNDLQEGEMQKTLLDVSTSTVLQQVHNDCIDDNDSSPLPISEDDIDAVLEQSNLASEQLSTEAVRFESREPSLSGPTNSSPPALAFRYGYMGHVIIICQALMNAYMHDGDNNNNNQQQQQQQQENERHHQEQQQQQQSHYDSMEDTTSRPVSHFEILGQSESGSLYEDDQYLLPKDDFGDPLLLAQLVRQHPLADQWNEFIATTLTPETEIQATPLGGCHVQQSPHNGMMMMGEIHSHRPGLVDEGYMMGDDGDRPPVPPPRGMLGGGDIIDMDDNDLDVAASMMAGLSYTRQRNSTRSRGNDISPNRICHSDFDEDSELSNSEKSANSDETSKERTGYAFDDPLGHAGGLGIELFKLNNKNTQKSSLKPAPSRSNNPKPEDQDDDDDDDNDSNDSHSSSSDEESPTHNKSDSDVPVMDLFVGNFDFSNHNNESSTTTAFHEPNINQQTTIEEETTTAFADFANFDDCMISDQLIEAPNDEAETGGRVGELDDFGPFVSTDVTVQDQQQQQPLSLSDFGNFDTVVVDIKEDDVFHLEPMSRTEFDKIFSTNSNSSPSLGMQQQQEQDSSVEFDEHHAVVVDKAPSIETKASDESSDGLSPCTSNDS